jgi:Zn-dependent protease
MPDEQTLLAFLIYLPILLFSFTLHEYGHAVVAMWGGDMTAAHENRVNLNPINHIDPIGSLLIPALMFFGSGGMLLGWARPVPILESNFPDRRWMLAAVIAGPFMNFLIALFGGLILGLFYLVLMAGSAHGFWEYQAEFVTAVSDFMIKIISLNILLIVFNLIPIPPLDGSHIFYHFFIRGKSHYYEAWDFFARFGIIFLLVAINVLPFQSVVYPITEVVITVTNPLLVFSP